MEELRNRRSQLGLSYHELATRSGLSAQAVWRIERGKASPTLRSLQKIAHGLGCRVEDLLDEEKRRVST